MVKNFTKGTFMSDEMISCRTLYKASGFSDDDAANAAIAKQLIKPGHVVVVRYAGPEGAPGMPKMFKPKISILPNRLLN